MVFMPGIQITMNFEGEVASAIIDTLRQFQFAPEHVVITAIMFCGLNKLQRATLDGTEPLLAGFLKNFDVIGSSLPLDGVAVTIRPDESSDQSPSIRFDESSDQSSPITLRELLRGTWDESEDTDPSPISYVPE
jgi:hypothetical protein